MPRQARSRALVEAVVQAATEQLRDESGTISMKAIAKRAGVSIGSVYEYFSSKEAIVDAIVDALAEKNFDALKATVDAGAHLPLADAVEPFVDKTIEVYLESPRLTRFALKTAVSFGRMDFVIKERDRFSAILADRFLQQMPDLPREDAKTSALCMAEMLSGIVMGELYREPDPHRRATLRAAFLRAVHAELEHLAQIQAQQTSPVPKPKTRSE